MCLFCILAADLKNSCQVVVLGVTPVVFTNIVVNERIVCCKGTGCDFNFVLNDCDVMLVVFSRSDKPDPVQGVAVRYN